MHTFIDTQIIAQAPEDLFWAGIGDALSKECEVLLATRKAELLHTPLLGAQLSRACTNPLVEFGAQALKDCQENAPTFALQEVALDIIVSTGLVSNLTSEKDGYYYNSSLAHAVYYGATMVPRCAHKHLHGEIVSFGVLCLLTYDGQLKERERLARFNKSVGLPVCLKDLDLTPQDLPVMAQKAATVTEWGCVPYLMDKQRFIDAILECDQFGQNL